MSDALMPLVFWWKHDAFSNVVAFWRLGLYKVELFGAFNVFSGCYFSLSLQLFIKFSSVQLFCSFRAVPSWASLHLMWLMADSWILALWKTFRTHGLDSLTDSLNSYLFMSCASSRAAQLGRGAAEAFKDDAQQSLQTPSAHMHVRE